MGFYDSYRVDDPDEQAELDLTNAHLHTLESVEVKPSLEYVDLTANRLKSIDSRLLELRGAGFALLLKLVGIMLCMNLLPSAADIQQAACKHTLQDLYINDNKLTEIPDLSGFQRLKRLEFSYNHEIKSLQPLASVEGAHLVELYCAENKIAAIEAVSHLTHLTQLELGSNRIKARATSPLLNQLATHLTACPRRQEAIEELEKLTGLEQLWLGRNRISSIAGLATLTNLKQLSLQANRLETMAGIGVCASLEELYLSQNGIREMQDLEALTRLTVLDLAVNRIEEVKGLEHQSKLSDLWLNDNPVQDLEHLPAALAACKDTLQVVYLENSPAARSTTAYLHIMKQMLPKLEQLDSTPIQR